MKQTNTADVFLHNSSVFQGHQIAKKEGNTNAKI